MKIIADDKIPFLRGVLEPFAEVRYLPGGKIGPENARDADALLVRTRTLCNEQLLNGSRVRFIASATIGMDHFDTAYLNRAGIFYCNAPGCNAWSVAQYMASALSSVDGELAGKTLGVIGAGNVGSRVAAYAEALGMKVLLNDPPRAAKEGTERFTELDELLKQADYVTCHVPLTRTGEYSTFHLGDEAFLQKMNPAAFLFNTARGEVVDGAALKEALRQKRIAGAVLDVWENEPEFDRELLDLVRFGTPHIAGYSIDGKAAASAMSVRQLAKFFDIPELLNWQPAGLPTPQFPEIDSPRSIGEAVRYSYDIALDDRRLRDDPAGFEMQRGNYPFRREFPAYMVRNASPELKGVLCKLGFTLL